MKKKIVTADDPEKRGLGWFARPRKQSAEPARQARCALNSSNRILNVVLKILF